MQQCRDMKRSEVRLPWATGFLIGMLWLQVSLLITEAETVQRTPVNKDIQEWVETRARAQKSTRSVKQTVHLLTASGSSKKESNIYVWRPYPNTASIFKLVNDSTTLVVPKTGLYFVNLKMYYQIPAEYECKENLILVTSIEQYEDAYPKWRDVLWGTDTMQCAQRWFQSVTLSQVVRFRKRTKLRVVTEPKNYNFIIKDDRTSFSVTLL